MSANITENSSRKPRLARSAVMDRLLIAVFCLLLLTPVVCQVAGIDLKGGAADEKRKLRQFPRLSLSFAPLRAFPHGVKLWLHQSRPVIADFLHSFPRDFDGWFTDHFGLRGALIRLHSEVVYFGLRSTPVPKVIVGKNGWLYYNSVAGKDGSDSVTDYRGIRPLSFAQLEEWRWLFQDENDWCEAFGKKFFLVLIPAKEAIYPENTPGWMARVSDKTALEQLTDYLQAKTSVSMINVSQALRDGRKRDRVFLRTDTHWSQFGAYCAYRAFMPMITNAFPAVKLAPDSDFTLWHDTYFGGDMTQMMALQDVTKEEYIKTKQNAPSRAEQDIAYSRELPDVVAWTDDTNLPRAVVFRDSFTESLIPFLSENFRQVAFSWARSGPDFNTIKREKPDLVMHIMADRLIRRGIRYPTQMREYCAMLRFNRATNILLATDHPRSVNEAPICRAPEGWLIKAKGFSPRVELGSLRGDTTKQLPIIRIDITMAGRTDLHLVWHDSHGEEQDLRADLPGGRRQIYFPLVEPDICGPLLLDVGHRPGDYILHSAEVRGIPR